MDTTEHQPTTTQNRREQCFLVYTSRCYVRCLSMEHRNPEKESLLEHYSNEVCSHVEAAISLFFGLIGTLIIMTVINTMAARVIFSVMYFVLGGLGLYFYIRLFYYRKLLEGLLLEKPYKDHQIRLQKHIFKKSKFIKWAQGISRHENGEYRLNWAWGMLALSSTVALLAWIIVFFSL